MLSEALLLAIKEIRKYQYDGIGGSYPADINAEMDAIVLAMTRLQVRLNLAAQDIPVSADVVQVSIDEAIARGIAEAKADGLARRRDIALKCGTCVEEAPWDAEVIASEKAE